MKKAFKYFLCYILYIIFLSICYNSYLIYTYGYYGFHNNMNVLSLFISVLIYLISFAYIYNQKTNSYSKFIVYILFLISYIPSVVTFSFMPTSYRYLALLTIYWFMLIVFTNIFNKITFKDGLKNFKSNIFGVYILVFVELVIISFVLLKYTGINLKFDDVYSLRENYFASSMPLIFTYLYAAFKVVNPLLFIYLYNRKKTFMALMSLLIQVLAFLGDGSKSTLFSIIIAFIIIKYVQRKENTNFLENDNFKLYILYGLVIINVLGFIENAVFMSSLIYNYFIRRLFFVPSLLNQCYYDFFTSNSVDLFRQSILGKLGFTSPYNMKIPKLISYYYFNGADMLANNGLFSDAYMNLGVSGVFIMPLLISLAFRFLDYCTKHIKPVYLITVLVSVSYIFLSSSFFTVLLTHGYLILCLVILIVIPKDNFGGDKN